MTEYMNSLTGDNLDTLEKIISHQYRKFVRFYFLVKEYSDIIDKLCYEFNSESSLDIIIKFKSKKDDLKSIKKELDKMISKNDYIGSVEIIKKDMMISISMEEE